MIVRRPLGFLPHHHPSIQVVLGPQTASLHLLQKDSALCSTLQKALALLFTTMTENSSHTSEIVQAGTKRNNKMLMFCLIFSSFFFPAHLLLEKVNSEEHIVKGIAKV